ncbi:MAG: glycosyltransferase [Acidobacteria bacterium]|nr:glycosyltransferase [Acidobacteriota bacterium]
MDQSVPFFSIIIPTYARPLRLAKCLRALKQLEYPPDRLEVIVVNDGGNERLDEIIQAGEFDFQVRLIHQTNQGPASARNTGARHATGDFLAFVDDDCEPAPEWLQHLAAQFRQTPEAMVGGHTINQLPHNLYSTASQLLIDYLYGYYNLQPGNNRFFTSNNLALAVQTFQTLGGFDATSFRNPAGEDRDLCARWNARNYPMVYLPHAHVAHSHELTLKSFWKQHFTYGCGAYAFHQARARRNQEHLKIEPFSFYWNLIFYPFRQYSVWSAWRFSLLFLLSQLANTSGFLWEWKLGLKKPGLRAGG